MNPAEMYVQLKELIPYLILSSSILVGAYWIRDGMVVKKKTTKVVKKRKVPQWSPKNWREE